MSELEAGGAAAPAPDTSAVIDTAPPAAGGEQQPERSLDDDLRATYRRINVNNGSDRDDNSGLFKSPNPEKEGTELAAQPPKEGNEPPPPVQAATTIDPPNSWAAEARANWTKLPPETQEYILKREGEAHKAITSYGERVKSYEPLDRVITQFKAHFDHHGLHPAQSFATLLEAQSMLDRNPIEGLVAIGRTYGIDLGAVLAGQQGQVPTLDPRVGQLEQRLARTEQEAEQRRQQQEQAQLAEVNALIETFKNDHPHFDSVEDELMGLIPVMRQRHPGLSQKELLEKAYDSATYANPAIRARIQEDQRVADEKKRKETEEKAREAAAAKSDDARKAGKLNVKGSVAHPTPKTMEDTIRDLARRAYRG